MNGNTLELLSITVSGGVFSLLLYENVKNNHAQDGFLLGKVEFRETKKLTDADHWVINKETVIRIKAVLPCPEQFHFYDSSGIIKEEKIRNFLGHNETDVIGWYVYRPTRVNMKLLLREKIIHKQLAKFFQLPVPHFSCCILLADSSPNKSTHSLTQTFVRYNRGSFDAIPLRIINLSDPMCTYKNCEHSSDIINNIIKDVKPSATVNSHLLAKNVQEVLQQKVKDLVSKVSEKEKSLYKLEIEVKELNEVFKSKRELVVEVEMMENGLEDLCEYKRVPKEQNKLIN